jgi:hypothetical protein
MKCGRTGFSCLCFCKRVNLHRYSPGMAITKKDDSEHMPGFELNNEKAKTKVGGGTR